MLTQVPLSKLGCAGGCGGGMEVLGGLCLVSSSHGLCLEWAVNLQTQVFVSSPDIWFYSSNKTPPPLPELSLSLKSVVFVQAQVSFSKYYVY